MNMDTPALIICSKNYLVWTPPLIVDILGPPHLSLQRKGKDVMPSYIPHFKVACIIGSANKVVLINIHCLVSYFGSPVWWLCIFFCINKNSCCVNWRLTWLGAPSLLASNFFTKSISLLTMAGFVALP
jgi:hypothetical protein